MRISPRFLVFALSLMALLVSCSPVAESQTLRERLRDRMIQRGGGGGNASLPAGTRKVTLSVAGQERFFLVHVPDSLPARLGVVIGLHGGGGTAANFIRTNSLLAHADRRGFLAVYPDGNRNWNDGRAAFAGHGDDVAFIRAMVTWLVANMNADRARVFALGVSNGGVFAHKLACDAPDLVAGIAPMSANFSETLFAACHPARPVPVVMFSGTDDPLMLFDGGRPDLSASMPGRGRATSTPENLVSTMKTIEFWASNARCGANARGQGLPDRADDGTTVTKITFSCPAAQVTLYRIDGGGHGIPGSQPRSGRMAQMGGIISQDIDAIGEAVAFFARYGL